MNGQMTALEELQTEGFARFGVDGEACGLRLLKAGDMTMVERVPAEAILSGQPVLYETPGGVRFGRMRYRQGTAYTVADESAAYHVTMPGVKILGRVTQAWRGTRQVVGAVPALRITVAT